MAFVLTAIWTARAGEEERVATILRTMAPLSRQEPGCLQYVVHRTLDDPRAFMLYEQYVDRASYEAHLASPHFERYAKGEALPLLESRERAFYETLDME